MIVVADELAYNTNNSAATAYDVAFASVPMQAHGYAKRLNKPDNTHYELEKVMFSTCPLPTVSGRLKHKTLISTPKPAAVKLITPLSA
nr:hypothetical protein [Psychrobacter sp. PraFG1]UNK04841.2 hypothetical protein MN210_11850 [Psychrobacter sp. PraFG1]